MTHDWPMRARREQSKAHPLAREVIEAMLPQLLIVLVERLGGVVSVPASEVDATGNRNLAMSLQDAETFTFKVMKK